MPWELGMIAHSYNPNAWEGEAGIPTQPFSATEEVYSQPLLHEILLQKQNQGRHGPRL